MNESSSSLVSSLKTREQCSKKKRYYVNETYFTFKPERRMQSQNSPNIINLITINLIKKRKERVLSHNQTQQHKTIRVRFILPIDL